MKIDSLEKLSILEQTRDAALADVEQLTVTRERASIVMTDDAVERNAELFREKPVVGLREFVDAQDTLGGKFAAFVATVGNPFLVSYAALSAMDAEYGELVNALRMTMIESIMAGEVSASTCLVAHAAATNGLIKPENSEEQNRVAADAFFADCLARAVDLALTVSTSDTIIPGDSTPGATH